MTISRFITDHGSVYTDTHRWKFDGSIHQRGEQTFFATNAAVSKIMLSLRWNNHSGRKSWLTILDNKLVLVVMDRRTKKVIDSECRVITSAITTPEIGLTPIEVWEKDSKYHVGHSIAHME